jgi:hypothetical protein
MVRCAVDQNGPSQKTVGRRYGHGRRINSEPLLYIYIYIFIHHGDVKNLRREHLKNFEIISISQNLLKFSVIFIEKFRDFPNFELPKKK